MANVVVVGAQWGDEGKGRVVDWLAAQADLVARYNGGHNAGHTLVVGGKTYKLALLPSGIVRGKRGVIGNGVALDPEALLAEIARMAELGLSVTPDNLSIAENATLVLPIHRAIDQAQERQRREPIGTTLRGIGPAYEDKVGRRGLRVGDLAERVAHGRQVVAARRSQQDAAVHALEQLHAEMCLERADHLAYRAGRDRQLLGRGFHRQMAGGRLERTQRVEGR